MPVKTPPLPLLQQKIHNSCTAKGHKLACIVFNHKGHVYDCDTNRQIHRDDDSDKWTFHAEEFVVRKLSRMKARERFRKLYILVARWRSYAGWGLAKPCPDCENILKSYGVDGVFYTDDAGNIRRLW